MMTSFDIEQLQPLRITCEELEELAEELYAVLEAGGTLSEGSKSVLHATHKRAMKLLFQKPCRDMLLYLVLFLAKEELEYREAYELLLSVGSADLDLLQDAVERLLYEPTPALSHELKLVLCHCIHCISINNVQSLQEEFCASDITQPILVHCNGSETTIK